MTKLNEFTCNKCGSHQLSYEKWVSYREDVIFHQDGHVEYGPPQIDETNELGGTAGFICRDCETPLTHRGCKIETEKDLIDYLSMSPEQRQEAEYLYQSALEEQSQQLEQMQEAEIESFISAEEKLTAN